MREWFSFTGVDVIEGLRVQTGSYELEYGGERTTSKQSRHLRVFIQSRQHQGTQLLLQTQQLHIDNKCSKFAQMFNTIQNHSRRHWASSTIYFPSKLQSFWFWMSPYLCFQTWLADAQYMNTVADSGCLRGRGENDRKSISCKRRGTSVQKGHFTTFCPLDPRGLFIMVPSWVHQCMNIPIKSCI